MLDLLAKASEIELVGVPKLHESRCPACYGALYTHLIYVRRRGYLTILLCGEPTETLAAQNGPCGYRRLL